MKPLIIYSSYTGTTHKIATQVHESCGGDLIEIKSWDIRSRFLMFFARYSPEMEVRNDGIPPQTIDVSGHDLVVIGTPVWMGKPTPAIKKTIDGLTGCAGKPAIVFTTCEEDPGTTLETMTKNLVTKGMRVTGQFSLTAEEIRDGTVIKTLIATVQDSGSGP